MNVASGEIVAKSQKKQRRERFWRYAPLLCWIAVIFIFSSKVGSMSNTSLFLRPLLQILFPDFSEPELAMMQGYIRKAAHFAIYAVLGIFAARAFVASANQFVRRKWFLVSLTLCGTIAALDEFNQSFLNSRTGSALDVLLDMTGSLTVLLVFYAARMQKKR